MAAEKLNPAQTKAVTHGEGPLLIVAGPGTGKTRVISHRIAHLVERGTDPDRILALTFSNKAAAEMQERTETLLSPTVAELSVATFHAFCARILREQAALTDLDPFFEPVGDADRLTLLLDNLEALNLRYTETLGRPAAVLLKLIERIDRCKDELIGADEYRSWAQSLHRESGSDDEKLKAARELEFASVFAKHDEIMREAGALDFGELIVKVVDLLTTNDHLRIQLSRRYDYILVDEYQDTNFAQAKLLQLLASTHNNITVVGDDDQSIYRFRGASEKNILDFRRVFPGTEVVNLDQNYRSHQDILDAAESIVSVNENRLAKKLIASAGRDQPTVGVRLWRCETARAQAQAIADYAEQLIAERSVDPGEICILVKSVKSEADELSVALAEHNLPFHLHGLASFYGRSEIRDALAWLRILTNPADAAAGLRVLARPPIELRSVDQARVVQIARRRRVGLIEAAELALDGQVELPAASQDQLRHFLALNRSLEAAINDQRPTGFIAELIEKTGLRKQQLFVIGTESLEKLLNLQKLQELARRFSVRRADATAREFATHIVSVAAAGMEEQAAEAKGGPARINVMTMHSAKGLEFDYVFVAGLTHRNMPGPRRSREQIPDALLKESLPEGSKVAHEHEMRRLLYVAVTRARRQAVLSWYACSTEGTTQKRSNFLDPLVATQALDEECFDEQPFGPRERLYSTFSNLRDDLLESISEVSGSLTQMRLDTALDVNSAIVEFAELLKVAALIERTSSGQDVKSALGELNQLLASALTAEQRTAFDSSKLDRSLVGQDRQIQRRLAVARSMLDANLAQFLPQKEGSVMLSATDIETYRSCPLKYKFARVYGVPQEQTVQQRFGILMHQVLERFHSNPRLPQSDNGDGLNYLLDLFAAGWRRSGLGGTNDEKQLLGRAQKALSQYYEDVSKDQAQPLWFERALTFKIGHHRLRGRVDRVDRLPDGRYELIDYKTGRPRTKSELANDIQLSLYQIGAKEAWGLDQTEQSYYYLLDCKKIPVQHSPEQLEKVKATATGVAESILKQEFEPKPSYSACNWCSFQMICPVAVKGSA